jgi:hypothetical protein
MPLGFHDRVLVHVNDALESLIQITTEIEIVKRAAQGEPAEPVAAASSVVRSTQDWSAQAGPIQSYLTDIIDAFPPPADGLVLNKLARGNAFVNQAIQEDMIEFKLLERIPADAVSDDVVMLTRKHTFPTPSRFGGGGSTEDNSVYWHNNSIGRSLGDIGKTFSVILTNKFDIRADSDYDSRDDDPTFTLTAETGEEGSVQREYHAALDRSNVVDRWEPSKGGERITIKESIFRLPTLGNEYKLFVVHPDELADLIVSTSCVRLFTFLGYGVVAARSETDVLIRGSRDLVARLHASIAKDTNEFMRQFIRVSLIHWTSSDVGKEDAGAIVHLPVGKQRRDIELVFYGEVLTVDRDTLEITKDLLGGHVTVIHGGVFYDPGNDRSKKRVKYLLPIFPDLVSFKHPIHPGLQPWLEENAPDQETGLCQALVYLRILAYVRGDTTGKTEWDLVKDLRNQPAREMLIKLITGIVSVGNFAGSGKLDAFWVYDPKSL